MKRNYNFIFFISIIIISIILLFFNKISSSKDINNKTVTISKDNEVINKFNITEEGIYDIELEDGIMKVEVINNSVCVKESPCLNKDCIKMGYTSSSNKDIICLPEKIIISIDIKDDIDAIAY